MDQPLTGRAAAEALGLAATLGNSGVRFDARRLAAALRTRAGRGRIRAGMTLAILVPRARERRGQTVARRAARRVLRAGRTKSPPDRPEPSGPASPSGEAA